MVQKNPQLLKILHHPEYFPKDAILNALQKLKVENERVSKRLNGRSKSSKSVVSISDMHVGSSVALAPPDPFIGNADCPLKPNKIMKRFYELWLECIDSTINGTPHVISMIGEPMNGANVKSIGDQNWTTDFNDQVRASSDLLKMWRAKNVVMVRGSDYHVRNGATNYEEMVAKNIGARRYRAYLGESITTEKQRNTKEGQIDQFNRAALTDYFANFKLGGKVFNMCHHIGYSKNEMYRTTAMAREMVTMKLSENFYGHCDIMQRGHVHYNVIVRYAHSIGYTNPAWKIPDGHLFRHGQGGTKPDIGIVEVIVEPNGLVIVEPHLKQLDIKPMVLDFDK